VIVEGTIDSSPRSQDWDDNAQQIGRSCQLVPSALSYVVLPAMRIGHRPLDVPVHHLQVLLARLPKRRLVLEHGKSPALAEVKQKHSASTRAVAHVVSLHITVHKRISPPQHTHLVLVLNFVLAIIVDAYMNVRRVVWYIYVYKYIYII
jgi:hypothetical protein